jgi:hypothetical protein
MAQCTKSPPGVLWIAPPAVISGIGYLAGPKTKSGRVVPGGARRLCLHCILYIMFYINIRYIILFIIIYIIIYKYYTPNQYIPRHSLAASVLPSLAPIDMTKEKKPEGIRGHKQPNKKCGHNKHEQGNLSLKHVLKKQPRPRHPRSPKGFYIYIYIFIDLFFLNFVSGPSI